MKLFNKVTNKKQKRDIPIKVLKGEEVRLFFKNVKIDEKPKDEHK